MLSITRSVLFVLLIYAIGCDAPALPIEDPPRVPDGFVFRPEFSTAYGQVAAGSAFVVSLPSHKEYVLLSAIHLLGTNGGLEQDVAATEIGDVVTELALRPCFGNAAPLKVKAQWLPIFEASAKLQPDGPGDIVAFWLPRTASVEARPFAVKTPAPGSRVWLVASVMEGEPPMKRAHGATVVDRVTFGLLYYEFDNADLSLQATSGAPILDADGCVVAIHLGRGSINSRLLGAGNPIGRFRPYLESAAERLSVP
jgi:hypothetical protein